MVLLSCNSSKKAQKNEAIEYFRVEVEQNGRKRKPRKNVIKLKKEPFKIKVTFLETEGVDVSASWDTFYYNYPADENIYQCNDGIYFKDCRFVAVKTAPQDTFNTQKKLAIGDEDYQWHWFYKADTNLYHFDKPIFLSKKNFFVGAMSVENIFDCDLRDSVGTRKEEYFYPVSEIDTEKNIYMVFATNPYIPRQVPKELQREKFIIKFKD